MMRYTLSSTTPIGAIAVLLPIAKLSCCRTAVGVGQRALSLSAHTAGGPPPSWPRGG